MPAWQNSAGCLPLRSMELCTIHAIRESMIVVTNRNTSTGPSSGSYSTTVSGDLVHVCLAASTQTNPTVFPAGYTQLTASTGGSIGGLWPSYLITSGSGAQTAAWTLSSSIDWGVSIMGYKP